MKTILSLISICGLDQGVHLIVYEPKTISLGDLERGITLRDSFSA
jgi:hypothetical protein